MKPFALITGASAGIGYALATEFAQRRVNLLLVALPQSGLADVALELEERYGVDCHFLETDLSQPCAPAQIFEWCSTACYHVQYLVNNAGFGNLQMLATTDVQLIMKMIMVNNHAMVVLTRLFIPLLQRFRRSYILNVGSLASFMSMPNKSLYAASKSFVYAFSSAMRLELRSDNIQVSCLCPGGTLTSAAVVERSKAIKANALFMMQPCAVAKQGVEQMLAGRLRIIPGWHNRLLFVLWRLLPQSLVDSLLLQLFAANKSGMRRRVKSLSVGAFALAFR